MTDATKAMRMALEALEAQHNDRTAYGRAKRKANATCAEFKNSPISELIESGYMQSMGKQTQEAIDALRAAMVKPTGYLIRARWSGGVETYLDVKGVTVLGGGKVGIDVDAPTSHPLADDPDAMAVLGCAQPQRAEPFTLTAKPIEWEQDDPKQWSEKNPVHWGFCIVLDDEDGDIDPPNYCAYWGESDGDQFDTLDEAKAWCQRTANSFIADVAQPQQATTQVEALRRDNDNLRTVMIAAAEEIHAHWAAHCDAEGYGPVNLMHRLEEGIPSEYGYTAGAFAALKAAQADEIAAAVAFERERCAALCEMWNTSPGSSLAKEIRGGAEAGKPQAEPVADELGWLIEMRPSENLLWWDGGFDVSDDYPSKRLFARMVNDVNKAVRFSRREDAQCVLDAMLAVRPSPLFARASTLYSVQEHMWIAAQPQQPTAAPAEPVAFEHDIGADRYQVVKGSFWWHVRIGDGTANVGKFHTKMAAEDMALKLLTAFRDGAYLQSRAAQPQQATAAPCANPEG